MRAAVRYTYVVARTRRRKRTVWALAVMVGGGLAETLTTYASRPTAVAAARLLASAGGSVEVRA